MYTRVETIEEENLNWENVPVQEPEAAPVEKTEFTMRDKIKLFLNKGGNVGRGKFSVKKMTGFINQNSEISSLFAVVVFPYILGFCFSYFLFYFYGGMSIGSFLGMEQNHLFIEMWSIGAYIFITAWVIWAIVAP